MRTAISSRFTCRYLLLNWLLLVSVGAHHGADAAPTAPSADQAFREGVRLFFAADIPGSAAAFDRVTTLAPSTVPRKTGSSG